MLTLAPLDVVVLVGYTVGVVALGVAIAGRQRGPDDYFLAERAVPWSAICFSIVATETSALTVVSVPATAYEGDLWLLQLALGYLVGRLAVAGLLLPGYFRGRMATAYALIERRFGGATRRFASLLFMVTRSLADSVRIFVAAIPLVLISGLPYWQAILLIGAATLVYTYLGGLRAVIWVDVMQLAVYTIGGVVALVVLIGAVPGGWGGIVEVAAPAHRLRIFHFDGAPADANWFWTGLIGGCFLSMASHGADHLIVQRLLAARSLLDGRRALVGSAVLVIAQFALFLFVGIGLYAYYGGIEFATPDEIFPRFIVERMPVGLAGLLIAAILAAAMSTVSSSLNSLASATTYDLYDARSRRDPVHLLRAGRVFTLGWAAVLLGGAILFHRLLAGTPVVVVALQIASFTYGGLLGGFLLALLVRRARQRDAMVGIGTAVVVMTGVWIAQQTGAMPTLVNSLWFAFLGSALTVLVGWLSSLVPYARPARAKR